MPDNQATPCFIDTNIWLYAFIETDDTTKSAIARTLIQESEPIVSVQVINDRNNFRYAIHLSRDRVIGFD